MKLPEIGYDVGKVRSEIVSMGGINYSDRFKEGDLRHSVNLSARRWPYITTRRAREQQSGYSGVTALTARDKLVAVQGTNLLYDGNVVGQVTPGEKQFATVNTKMVIWPDKVYLDLEDNRVKPMGAKATLSPRSVVYTKNSLSTDNRPAKVQSSPERPEEPTYKWESYSGGSSAQDRPYLKVCSAISRTAAGWVLTEEREINAGALGVGALFLLSTSEVPNMRWGRDGYAENHGDCYGRVTEMGYVGYGSCDFWYEVVYCPLQNPGLLGLFKVGDAVAITGAGENDKEAAVIEELTDTKMTFSANLFEKEGEEPGAVTLERKVPKLDFICESQNRLWGCEGHTIWASALGDPTNFYVNKGASTDSYAVAVGTEGNFTGCCKLGSSVLFWKETKLHKVLGSFPAEYSVYTYETEGLKAGCHKSLQVINDVLFYMGIHGVYLYTGGTPSLISDCFGELELSEAVAGTDGDTYYLSAKEEKGTERHLLLYETKFSIWVREDNTKAVDFARIGRKLYFADGSGKVWLADNGQDDPNMEWLCQFTPFYETISGRKSYSKILLRMELPKGSWVIADVRCDGGPWRECGKIIGRENDVIPLRLALNRCDKFEIRLRGKGPCAILSMLREYSVGSDV